MKIALIGLSSFTFLAAGWLCFMETVLRRAGFGGRMAVDALIAAQCLLTILVAARLTEVVWRAAASAGACALFALGISAFLKNEAGAHFEGYVFLISLALMLQGVLTLAHFWGGTLLQAAAGRPSAS